MARKLDKLRVYILCEDRRHQDFMRHFLVKAGVNGKRIVPATELPEGRGSGEQHVRDNFAVTYRKYKVARAHWQLREVILWRLLTAWPKL